MVMWGSFLSLQMAAVASVFISIYMYDCICKVEAKRPGQNINGFIHSLVDFFGDYE